MTFDINEVLFDAKLLGSKISDCSGVKHTHCYSKGYCFAEEDGVLTSLFLSFTDGYHAYKAFTGGIVFNGKTQYFNEHTSVAEIESVFINTVDGHEDNLEISRTFVTDGLEIECSWYHDVHGISFTYILVELEDGFYSDPDT